jgi:pyruvate kinase
MDKIARTVEQSFEFRTRMKNSHNECFRDTHDPNENLSIIMSRAGVETAADVRAKAIVTPTMGGNTARILSVFRPDEPVFAVTPDHRAERRMQIYWGVQTRLRPRVDDTESMIQDTMKIVMDSGVAGISDIITLVAGLPLNSPAMTNTVRVLILGTVLAQSSSGGFANPAVTRARGRIIHALTPEEARKKIMTLGGGEVLVCKDLTEDYIPIIRMLSGIICEGVCEISEQNLGYTNPRLIWLTHVKDATKRLESGLTVTIDAKQQLIYEGTV